MSIRSLKIFSIIVIFAVIVIAATYCVIEYSQYDLNLSLEPDSSDSCRWPEFGSCNAMILL